MAAARTKLDDILGEEAQNIGDSLKNRIEEHIKILDDCISNLKNVIVQNKVATESQEVQLEKELVDCQTKLQDSNNSSQQLQLQISGFEKKLKDVNDNFEELRSEHSKCTVSMQTVQTLLETSEQEKKELGELLEKKDKEVLRLSNDLQNLTAKLTDAHTAKYEALLKVEEIRTQELNWQHHRKRVEQDKELLSKQVAALNQEIGEKSQEILKLRKECTTQSLELRADIERYTDEARMAEKHISELKNALQEREGKIETSARRVKEVEQNHLQAEEHFHQEIRAQTKLSDLYKKSAEDAEKRVEELLVTVEDMHRLLKETADSHLQLEQKLNEGQEEFDLKLKEKEGVIVNLKKELEHANHLLVRSKALGFSEEGLELLFPAASATSKALKTGSTLTEIYSEFVKSQEELQKEKTEKQQLNQQLQHILAEIEDKTPVIKRRFEEYQSALETISCLRSQLSTSITEQEKIQAKSDDACRMTGYLQRENERLKQTSADLTQQVRVLVKELEEAKGNHVSMDDNQEPEISSSNETTSASVISSHLVTFRGIEDLHEKNQMLLSVIRDLSEQQEEQERIARENRSADMKTQLEEAMNQLEELRGERTRQAELVESIVQQRDTYRMLLSQYQSISPLRSVTPLLSSTPQQSAGRVSLEESKLQESLKERKNEFDTYKREMAENIRMLNEQLDKFRDESSELKIQNACLSSQLNYAQERFETVQTNLQTYKDEVSILREMNQKFTTSITQHQKTIAVLRQDLITTQEQLSKAEVAVQNLQSEKELLKNAEVRLLQEKDSLKSEQQIQTHLLANLQAVQNNLERLEAESRLAVTGQLQKAEEEVTRLRKKLEGEEERYRASLATWEKRVADLQDKMASDKEKQSKTQDELVDAYAQVHQHSRTITDLETKLATAQKNQTPTTNQPVKAEENRGMLIKNMQGKINELNAEVHALRDNLTVTQKNLEQFRTLSSELEKRLMEETESSKQLRESAEKSLAESKNQHDALQKEMDVVTTRNNKLVGEAETATKKITALESQIAKLEQSLKITEVRVAEAQKVEDQAREDCQKQLEMMKEAQTQYQRELMLHAASVESLNKLKEQVGSAEQEISAAKEASRKWESNLAESSRSWKEQEVLLKQQAQAAFEKCTELETQNSSLLEQLELMSSQMAALKTKDWSNIPHLEESTQKAEYTVEVVRYLRKEKSIAMARAEAAEAEVSRLKVQLAFVERRLDETRNELTAEREKAQVVTTTEAQYRELLQKVEMLNILTESNHMLRVEKESLEKKSVTLNQRVQDLESRLVPMEKESRELSSKVDVLGAENNALRSEIKKWQTRCNQLLEQSRKMDPEDFKKLQEENAKLKKELASISESLGSRDAELGQAKNNMSNVQRELEEARKAAQASRQDSSASQKELESAKKEMTEQQKTILQVKKIARKYKTQYDELKVQFTDLEGKTAVVESDSLLARQQGREEVQQELREAEEQLKKKVEEVEKMKEELGKMSKEETERMAQVAEREERSRRLMVQARKRIAMLTADRDKSKKDLENMAKELEESKTEVGSVRQSAEEDTLRLNTIKTQLEAKIVKMEKELVSSKERSDRLEKQVEELTQKVAQKQKQVSKPSTSIERSNVAISEPLTANIRPLTPPSTSVSSGTLRHTQHPSAPSSRLPPTASIRPMAIGASTATTSGHQAATRMAAVPPTTATISTTDEVPSSPVTTAHILPTVPQAAVQPTPVVPSTIITSAEQQTTAPNVVVESSVDTDVRSSGDTIFVAAVPVQRYRTEHSDDSRSATDIEDVASCVSTSSPQTQVVTPTVKRPREEAESPRDTEESGSTSAIASQSKRIRMVSEASQTIERATVVTSSSTTEPESKEGPSKVSEEPVVPERPGVIVTPEPQPVSQQEVNLPEPELSTVAEAVSQPESHFSESQPSPPPEEIVQESEETDVKTIATKPPMIATEEENIVEAEEDQKVALEAEEDEEEEEYDEGMDDEGEAESYEEEHMQEVGFSQEEDEDDMAEDLPFDGDGEEMADPPTEEVEIIDEDDSQMDAQETAAVPASSSPEEVSMSRSAGVPTTEMSESSLQGALSMGHHRPPLLPRVPGRAEHLPSVGRQQQLVPFSISGQTSGFEEGDDSIVPSTPTLFVPRRGDGFAEAISSPHVPQGRFVFSSASGDQPGLSQLASQGALGVDDTRMDLSQFDEGCGRSVPSTPLQVSPPADVGRVVELGEVSMTQEAVEQGLEGSIPTITVTSEEDPGLVIQEDPSSSAEKLDATPTIEEPETSEAAEAKEQAQGLVIVDITSLADVEKGEELEDQPTVTNPEEDGSQQESDAADGASGKGPGQRKPIIWEGAASSSAPAATATSPFPSPAPRPRGSATTPQPRGRRLRVRGSTTNLAQRGRWPGSWRGRGRGSQR